MNYSRKLRVNLCGIAILFFLQALKAQPTQQIRGTIIDAQSQQPIADATVSLDSLNRSVVTDKAGTFLFNEVPLGRHGIRATHVSYYDGLLDQILVTAGKEVVLNIALVEKVEKGIDIVVKATSRKNR